jgi:hypothetical protein
MLSRATPMKFPLAATRKAAWGGKGGTRAWRSISKASRLCSICRHPKSGGKRFLQSLRAAPPWEQQGQSQEAYDILAPVSHWVIEGCDTDDLQNAKTLLEALACVRWRRGTSPENVAHILGVCAGVCPRPFALPPHAEGALRRKGAEKTRKKPHTPQPTSPGKGLRERCPPLDAAGRPRVLPWPCNTCLWHYPTVVALGFPDALRFKYQAPWYHKASRTREYP